MLMKVILSLMVFVSVYKILSSKDILFVLVMIEVLMASLFMVMIFCSALKELQIYLVVIFLSLCVCGGVIGLSIVVSISQSLSTSLVSGVYVCKSN